MSFINIYINKYKFTQKEEKILPISVIIFYFCQAYDQGGRKSSGLMPVGVLAVGFSHDSTS